MSVLVVKHHEEDSAGLVGEALSRRGASLRELLVPGPRPFPDPGAYERIVVLGAKWSVYDTATVGAFLDDELGTSDLARARSYLEEPLRLVAHLIMSAPEYQLA